METPSETGGIAEPTAALERAFIQQYLRVHASKDPLSKEQSDQLWKDAVLNAALRLEEVTSRARMLEGLRDQPHCM